MPDIENLTPSVEQLLADSKKLGDSISAAMDLAAGTPSIHAADALARALKTQTQTHTYLQAAARDIGLDVA